MIMIRKRTSVPSDKPLLALLNQHRSTSEQASARIRRWSLFLSTYEYVIRFRKTEEHGNTDALSQLPLPEEPLRSLCHRSWSCFRAPRGFSQQIETWTRQDLILAKVLQYVRHGWPEKCGQELASYSSKRNELSVYGGCVLWGSCVVIPTKARGAVLTELHKGHPGMTRTNALARMYVWWPHCLF